MEYKATGRKVSTELSEECKQAVRKEILSLFDSYGLSQVQVAEKIGMSKNQLWNIMHKKSFDMANIETIANALDCSVEIKFVPKTQKGEN
ncbi:MAG: helix-turn-helix transcriptional regulator [Clostridia bacterium]